MVDVQESFQWKLSNWNFGPWNSSESSLLREFFGFPSRNVEERHGHSRLTFGAGDVRVEGKKNRRREWTPPGP